MKAFLKTIALFFCFIAAKLLVMKNKPVILMYHSFDDVDWPYGVAPSVIKRQMEHLIKHKNIVPLADVIEFTQSKKSIPDNVVAVTIDDGYADTYEVFFPLAKKYKIPFTLFLTTDLSRQQTFGNLPRPTWEQLREMNDSGLMTIGLHGHTHKDFVSVVKSNLVSPEIEESENLLEKEFDLSPKVAAYPWGIYNNEVIDVLKDRGYVAACSIHSGPVSVGDDPYRLRRVEVSRHISMIMFILRLTPALVVYKRTILRLKPFFKRRR